MAQAEGEVRWREKEFLLVVDGASDDLLTRLAFQGEAHAKVNVTEAGAVDTGFMRNAIYGLGPRANHRTIAEVEASAAAGRLLGGNPQIEAHEAAVHAAALYTIYQEAKHGFLYQMLEQLKRDAGGTIREVGKEHFGA